MIGHCEGCRCSKPPPPVDFVLIRDYVVDVLEEKWVETIIEMRSLKLEIENLKLQAEVAKLRDSK